MSAELLTELQRLARELRDAQGRMNQVWSLNWEQLDTVDADRLSKSITMVHQTAKRLEQLAPETGRAA